jgi:NADPH-dependent 2,4-dienoyl-CoA reductase/sulfur reductase-like enzyme
VPHWQRLAHRTRADLEGAGIGLFLDTRATEIDVDHRRVHVSRPDGRDEVLAYDALVLGTGAISARPPILGLTGAEALGPRDGVHLLHSMGNMFAITPSLQIRRPRTAIVIGAGYIGLEMAEALAMRGILVTQLEALPEVLPTVDPDLGALVHEELTRHEVDVHTGTTVTRVERDGDQVLVHTPGPDGASRAHSADLVLVVVGVRPDARPAAAAGARLPIAARITGDTRTGRLLGAQLVGRRPAEISKRVDTFAAALFHEMTVDQVSDLDLSYTPPLGSPWDAVQIAAQAWQREHGPAIRRAGSTAATG